MWIETQQYKEVGACLEAVRKDAGVTQRDLAQRLGKPQSFVSSYESGQRRIDVLELIRIAGALGHDPRSVFAVIVDRAAKEDRAVR